MDPGMLMFMAGISYVAENSGGDVIGDLYGWGLNGSGNLGQNDATNRSSPVQIGGTSDIKSFSASRLGGSAKRHAMYVKNDGTLWAIGANSDGELGLGDTTTRSSPVQVGVETDWDAVVCGGHATYAVKTGGTLWACGLNGNGRLGLGDTTSRSTLTQVGALTDWTAKIGAGSYHVLAIKSDGTLWAWGVGSDGCLGDGTTAQKSSPVQIGAATDWQAVAASASQINSAGNSSFGIRAGALYSWGDNASGVLGLGDTTARSSPVQVGALSDWAKITCTGYDNTALAIKTDQTLWSWGDGDLGCLGDTTLTDRSSPVQVGADLWNEISGGCEVQGAGDGPHVLGIKDDGTLHGWGCRGEGRIGDGTAASSYYSSPVQVGAETDWVLVCAGSMCSYALRSA